MIENLKSWFREAFNIQEPIEEGRVVEVNYRGEVVLTIIEDVHDHFIVTSSYMYYGDKLRLYRHGYVIPIEDIIKVYPKKYIEIEDILRK